MNIQKLKYKFHSGTLLSRLEIIGPEKAWI